MHPHQRIEDPAGGAMVAQVHARVPEEVRALRQRLTRLRREHGDTAAVVEAVDAVSRALDDLTMALLRDLVDADHPDRPHQI